MSETGKSQTVKDVLGCIKKINGLRDSIRQNLGLAKTATDIVDNDIYIFEYTKPEMEHKERILLHGKCIEKGQKELLSWGYEFLQLETIKSDSTKIGVMCKQCSVRLDEKAWAKHIKERSIKLINHHADYLEERAIREEWEAEQILLGKL